MYAQFFGLRELPFNNTPDPRFFYSTPDHEEALALLVYAVSERKEFAMLTGEIGAGKTLVSRMMLRHFGSRIVHAVVNHAVHSGAELLEVICTELGLEPGAETNQASLTRALHDFLLQQFSRNTPVVLLLDEAQNLPIEAFEQLRMIGNLESDDAKLLQTIIVGQPELRRILACPELRQLAQRVFRSFHLPALNRAQTEAYIRHRLKVAGNDSADVFDAPVFDAIHAASDGLPRVINTLCDNIMLSAFSADRRRIDRAFADMVICQTRLPRGDVADKHPARNMTRTSLLDGRTSAKLLSAAAQVTGTPLTPSTATTSPTSAWQASDESRHLPLVVDEVLRRLDGLEHQLARAATSMADHRVREAETASVVAQAKTVATRVDAACRELRQRELSIDRLTSAGRSILDEMNRIVSEVRKSAALLEQKQKSAGAVADLLTERIHYARELARRTSGPASLTTHPAMAGDPIATARGSREAEQESGRSKEIRLCRGSITTTPRSDVQIAAGFHPLRSGAAKHSAVPGTGAGRSAAQSIKEGDRRSIEFNPKMNQTASQRLAANVDELLRFVENVGHQTA